MCVFLKSVLGMCKLSIIKYSRIEMVSKWNFIKNLWGIFNLCCKFILVNICFIKRIKLNFGWVFYLCNKIIYVIVMESLLFFFKGNCRVYYFFMLIRVSCIVFMEIFVMGFGCVW